MPASAVITTIDLGPSRYQSTLAAFRGALERSVAEIFDIAVLTPRGETIELQVRSHNAYIIGFKGADGWYSFSNEAGARGVPCGTGSNYNELGFVGKITYDDLNALGTLAQFSKGVALNKRLVAILIAVTSEAARFATVATYFIALTNSVGTEHSAYLPKSVDFEYLKQTYFNNWASPPMNELEPGKVYHFVGTSGILLPHSR